MIIGKSQKEIEKMRASGQLVGRVLRELRADGCAGCHHDRNQRCGRPDDSRRRRVPDVQRLPRFPYSICASVNEQVVHGFPSKYELKEGDIFSIDVGATLDGFVGDTATTVPVGQVSEDLLKTDSRHRRVSAIGDRTMSRG